MFQYLSPFAKEEHCVKRVRIWSYSGLSFLAFELNTGDMEYLSLFSPNAGKCGHDVDQNNSECRHFSRSGRLADLP